MEPFKPADGHKGRKWYCYDLVLTKEPNDEITYQEIADLLDCSHQTALAAMRDAKRQLELDKLQTVRTVPRFGWIVMTQSEHLTEIDRRNKRTGNQANASARLVLATRRDALSPFEQARLDKQSLLLARAAGIYEHKRASIIELERLSRKLPRPPVPGELGETS